MPAILDMYPNHPVQMELLTRPEISQAITANRKAVLGDETGAEAERFADELIAMVSESEADWLFENWDEVLKVMQG